MEDEECLPENSSLKLYLENLGFSDLQVTKGTPQNPSSIRFEVTKLTSKLTHAETIEEDVIDQISIIISTQMLFEEDILNIEKLLSNFKVVKTGLLKSIFKDLFGVPVVFLGLCLFWVIGHYAFFIVSSFYAFSAANYLRRKFSYRTRLKKLTSILQGNFMLLKKTVKFIEENRVTEEKIASAKVSKEFIEGFDFYKNFKTDFTTSVNEIINILVQSTQKLINKIPLHEYIENPEYYLCNNFNKKYDSTNLTNLYEIYLLVQSEFLQRLILSLIPNIKLSNTDNFNELNKILTETCLNLLKIKNKLSKKFKFIFLNGIHWPKNKAEFKLLLKSKQVDNNYLKECILNVHETSKNLQNILLKCRILEENLMFHQKISSCAEEELVKIQAGLNNCQRNISDSFVLFQKVNFITENTDNLGTVQVQGEEEVNSTEKLNKIMVGYTDLDPKTEDEIFEAYFTNDDSGRNVSDFDDLDLNSKRKVEKEYCKNVMKELKIKLVEKAKNWKKRERQLLKKKGIIHESESESFSDERDIEKETENLEIQNFSVNEENPFIKCQEEEVVQNFDKNDLVLKGSKENKNEEKFEVKNINFDSMTTDHPIKIQDSDKNNVICFETGNTQNVNSETENTPEASLQVSSSFLLGLSQARQKIFKSTALEEELFYASGEDSSSEGEFTRN